MKAARWALVALACVTLAGCAKKKEAPPAPPPVKAMSADEIQRGKDACQAYVDKACACTAPDAARLCQLAKGQPESIRLALEIAQAPDAKPDVAEQSYDSVRKTTKACIEDMAKLPSQGCP
jgi:hypothetical protein